MPDTRTIIWITRERGWRWEEIGAQGSSVTLRRIGGTEQVVTVPRRELEKIADSHARSA